MSFHFAPSDSSDSDSESDLPFPAPLSTTAFSAPSPFSPHDFLSTLTTRHQTLEDLRHELITRSRSLSTELIELVNRDYASFLSLGTSVRGGDARVQDLRVGLLGFAREVEGVRTKVAAVREEVAGELAAKEGVRKEKRVVRRLLGVVGAVEELEGLLMIDGKVGGVEGDGEGLTSTGRLRRCVGKWGVLEGGWGTCEGGEGRGVLRGLEGRRKVVRETLVGDLRSALREARREGDQVRCLEVLEMFARLGEEGSAVRTLKEM